MGLIDSLFGKNKTENIGNDGAWLSMERNSSWTDLAKLNETQIIEVSRESCYTNQIGTFCVLRFVDKNNNSIVYWGCCIPDKTNEFIHLVVNRIEGSNGEVIKKDEWPKNRVFDDKIIPNLSDAIQKVQNHASFNNYSTVPPFVYYLMLNLGN